MHALIGEVGEGVAERRQFPVEHRQNLGLAGCEDHVVQPIVAMHQRDTAVIGRHMRLQPGDQPVHVGDRAGFRGAVLAGPAGELAFEIIAGFAEIAEPDRFDIDVVQCGQRGVHGVVDRRALLVAEASGTAGSQKMRPSRNSMT